MAGDHSPAIILLGVGNEKTAADSLGKSCGHTIYWGLGGKYETGDISNMSHLAESAITAIDHRVCTIKIFFVAR